METTPFPHQGPLAPEAVRGRDDLLGNLTEKVTSRTVTALLGPRRFGKTSVLRRLAHDRIEVATVWVDLYGATSVLDVASRFDAALHEVGAPAAHTARLEASKVGITLGMVRVEMARPARDRPDPTARLAMLLDIIVALARSTPALLVLDEFSYAKHADNTVALLRTKLQHHYTQLGLVFAGSEPSVMRTMFSERAEPFFGQADIVTIAALTGDAVTSIVHDGFVGTGRDPGNAPGRVHALTGGHPQRTMQTAHAIWSLTSPGASADDDLIARAIADVQRRVAREMEIAFDHQPTGAKHVLRLVAHGQPPHGATAAAVDLSTGSATHNRDALLASGDLSRDGEGALLVTDPLFADWLRNTLPL